MQRKTINNEGECRQYQEQMFKQGYVWNGVGSQNIILCGDDIAYPLCIISRPDSKTLTWSTKFFTDIAETISNEAVYLEALEHVYDEVCRIAREKNEMNVEMGNYHCKVIAKQDESLIHIRNICALAIQASMTGTGEVDNTQELKERGLTYQPEIIGGNGKLS